MSIPIDLGELQAAKEAAKELRDMFKTLSEAEKLLAAKEIRIISRLVEAVEAL